MMLLGACTSDYFLDVPVFGDDSFIDETEPLNEVQKYSIEGIYLVVEGQARFGDTLILKNLDDKFSVFGRKNGIYAIMDIGHLDSLIIFEGYWRESRTTSTGLARFTVVKLDGGHDIMNGDTTTPIIITGIYGNDRNLPNKKIKLRLLKRFTQKIRNDKFYIVGHRGGGRSSDKLPHSENCPAMFNFSKYLGCNGIEIDIWLTKDNIPVLYHDSKLNIRLIQKTPIYGPIKNYTYKQLVTFVRLIHGERLPTLRESLEFVLNKTKIKFVWLDMKEAEAVEITREIQRDILKRAEEMGRDLHIYMGMPSQDVYDAVKEFKQENPEDKPFPTLCELDPQYLWDINADAWGPRWTMGSQKDVVRQMHDSLNNPIHKYVNCLVWTLDVPVFIEQYIEQGHNNPTERFDGLLTNYPTIVAYYYYVRYND
jgi:glycerophosphoryl diester phosphodiesterase